MRKLATTILVLVVVCGVYAATYLAACPQTPGIRRAPWSGVVERKSKAEEVCKIVFGPCIWVERQWLVSKNIGRAEGEWVTRDGRHSVEVRRVWGNTFEVSSKTGWIDEPVRARGNSPGCGPMVVTGGRVTLLPSSTKPQMSLTVDRRRETFAGPL